MVKDTKLTPSRLNALKEAMERHSYVHLHITRCWRI